MTHVDRVIEAILTHVQLKDAYGDLFLDELLGEIHEARHTRRLVLAVITRTVELCAFTPAPHDRPLNPYETIAARMIRDHRYWRGKGTSQALTGYPQATLTAVIPYLLDALHRTAARVATDAHVVTPTDEALEALLTAERASDVLAADPDTDDGTDGHDEVCS